MEDFKQYLSEGADDRERDAARQVLEGLAGMRLEQKVAEVATERRALIRRRFWMRIVWIATLVIIAGVAVLFFWRTGSSTPSIEVPKQIEQTIPQQVPPVQERSNELQPIAKRPNTPQEQAERPLMRSVQPDLDSTTNRLIDLLLNRSEQDDTSKKLAPQESTVLWADAIRLLKKNKPAEAKSIIFKLEEVGGLSSKDAQWLLGIALLEEGKLDEAQAIFEKIAKELKHPRRKDAQMAVDALR